MNTIATDLPGIIFEVKRMFYEHSGEFPDTIYLPVGLYYQLVFTLRETYDFKELHLDSWEGMEIVLMWQDSYQFSVNKRKETRNA